MHLAIIVISKSHLLLPRVQLLGQQLASQWSVSLKNVLAMEKSDCRIRCTVLSAAKVVTDKRNWCQRGRGILCVIFRHSTVFHSQGSRLFQWLPRSNRTRWSLFPSIRRIQPRQMVKMLSASHLHGSFGHPLSWSERVSSSDYSAGASRICSKIAWGGYTIRLVSDDCVRHWIVRHHMRGLPSTA